MGDSGASRVSLEPITLENWREGTRLEVLATQIGFMPSVTDSILEAQFFPDSEQFLIRAADAAHAIGYTLFGREIGTGRRKIFRLLIDRRHQGHGHGRQATHEILTRFFADADCSEVFLCHTPENERAAGLYTSMGFEESARLDENGAVVASGDHASKLELRLSRMRWEKYLSQGPFLVPRAEKEPGQAPPPGFRPRCC